MNFKQCSKCFGRDHKYSLFNRDKQVALESPSPEEYSTLCLPVKVSIFGSCTTRDLFRLYPSEKLELKTYIARQSVVSAVSKPVPLEKEQIKLDSAFQKTVVWYDFNKTTFPLFKEDGSDWLLIDLIDEHYAPVRIGDSYVTKSTLAVNGGVIPDTVKGSGRIWNGEDYLIDGVPLRNYIKQFAEKQLKIYRPDHIIIHRAMNVEQYRNAAGELCNFTDREITMGRTVNKILTYMYDYLKSCIPEAREIDIISGYYGKEQHQWGKATVHYEDEYYAAVMEQVKAYIGV